MLKEILLKRLALIFILTKSEIEDKYSTHISKNTIDLDNEIIFGDGKPYSQINVFFLER